MICRRSSQRGTRSWTLLQPRGREAHPLGLVTGRQHRHLGRQPSASSNPELRPVSLAPPQDIGYTAGAFWKRFAMSCRNVTHADVRVSLHIGTPTYPQQTGEEHGEEVYGHAPGTSGSPVADDGEAGIGRAGPHTTV